MTINERNRKTIAKGKAAKHIEDVLAAHAESLSGHPEAMQQVEVTNGEREQLDPLFELAGQLQQSMAPVQPSSAFVHTLGRELAHSAQHQIAAAKRMRRGILIGAAAVGSLVSIASIVGAIILVVSRLRGRSHAHQAPTAPAQ